MLISERVRYSDFTTFVFLARPLKNSLKKLIVLQFIQVQFNYLERQIKWKLDFFHLRFGYSFIN